MTLDADWVVDRRRLKRHLTAWRLIALVALIAVVATAVGYLSNGQGFVRGAYVGRLDVEGMIISDRELYEHLDDIAMQPNVKALIVNINSPGGTVVGGEQLFSALRQVAEHKPVVAVMGELAASAAYMIALGADRIFANPGTVTGSIGVILQSADLTGLMDKLGIEPVNVKSSPLKAQPNPLEPVSAEARAMIEAVINDFHAFFVGLVAERRGLGPAEARALGDGRIFSGSQALQNRLIDALGDERDARRWLAENRNIALDLPTLDVDLPDDERLFSNLVTGMVGKVLLPEWLRLDGLVSIWHPSLR
ncbi:MAG: signal peptide peptidase SppA [Proteobacteria bacterium]|nr:signal peptide peptidase SppA [Pseudomonadota bacterium]